MKSIKCLAITLTLLITIQSITFSQANSNEESLIQMAILLDTSNSMDGLIDQAKSNLWKIVNEMALSKKNGKTPMLEVALFEYGKSTLAQEDNYLRQIVPLTTDLDLISEELFNLTTNGGDEYCGAVIQEAVKQLKWTKNNSILKVIFIAGNEPFNQGLINYKQSVKQAISKGIIVNTIFCGDIQEGIDTGWKDAADRADGSYVNIDQNQVTQYIEAPQDKRIMELNNELNQTYKAYGTKGAEKEKLQKKQDTNAFSMNEEAAIQRAVSKTNSNYSTSSWDLVDAYQNGNIKLKEIKNEDLPKEMQKMTLQEKEEYIKKLIAQRDKIQKEIQILNEERKKYIDKIRKEQAEENSLDDAIIQSIKKQAKEKDYQF